LRRFVLLFGLFACCGFLLLLAPPLHSGVAGFTTGLAAFSAAVIHLGSGHVQTAGDIMSAPNSAFSMQISNGCNGLNVVILLWSALLAWPAPLIGKLKGMLAGLLIVETANVARIIALFYFGQWSATWFEWMHVYIGEILIMILGLAVFAGWIRQTQAIADAGRGQ
jgi:exosortase H (IPTLxxWG-CTERM-specific)